MLLFLSLSLSPYLCLFSLYLYTFLSQRFIRQFFSLSNSQFLFLSYSPTLALSLHLSVSFHSLCPTLCHNTFYAVFLFVCLLLTLSFFHFSHFYFIALSFLFYPFSQCFIGHFSFLFLDLSISLIHTLFLLYSPITTLLLSPFLIYPSPSLCLFFTLFYPTFCHNTLLAVFHCLLLTFSLYEILLSRFLSFSLYPSLSQCFPFLFDFFIYLFLSFTFSFFYLLAFLLAPFPISLSLSLSLFLSPFPFPISFHIFIQLCDTMLY